MNQEQINNFPCSCGHAKVKHSQMYCFECFDEDVALKTVGKAALRGAHQYLPDNLAYLESKYDKLSL